MPFLEGSTPVKRIDSGLVEQYASQYEIYRNAYKHIWKNGFDLDAQTIAGLVEKIYQVYKIAGGDNHVPVVPPAPTEVMPPAEGTESND